ncbi:hypothetical protein G5V59_26475 [Nocardioides sp. W3-2-3]|uniref:hypothetical protein n=1 Tax=Nocardioides convexus TaxID=2712224 RepID=UPI0024184A70|nr:hypothetical protein [Nocardioides convexus]NHA01971.1 hypothetical protein [Nocardioides convexus]
MTTLSYWRSGQRTPDRRPSLEAIGEIEAILGLKENDLLHRLPGPRRRRAGDPVPFDESAAGLRDGRAGRHRGRRVPGDGPPHGRRQRTRRDSSAGGCARLVVADREGVTGFTLFHGPAAEDEENRTVVLPAAGCGVEDVRDLEHGIRSTWVVFERPLRMGEAAMTEVKIRNTDGAPPDLDQEYAFAAEQRLEEAVVWVRFHPDRVPARVWLFFSEAGLRHEWEVPLDGARSIHHRQTDFGPGTLGARWEW